MSKFKNVQILSKSQKLSKYCRNVVKILSKYGQNIVKILSKYCQNTSCSKMNYAIPFFLSTENSSNSPGFLTKAWIPSHKMDTNLFYVCFWFSYWHFILHYSFTHAMYRRFRPLFIHSLVLFFNHFTLFASISFTHRFTSFFKDHPSFHPSSTHFRFHSFNSCLVLRIALFTHPSPHTFSHPQLKHSPSAPHSRILFTSSPSEF